MSMRRRVWVWISMRNWRRNIRSITMPANGPFAGETARSSDHKCTAMRIIFIVLLGVWRVACFAQPQAEISNGVIHARFYLPDSVNGYYRSTRFDWSGVMSSLEYNGHSYFGQWFEKYAPLIHDAIMGPVESFSPLGYGVGDSFTQIGVGVLA